MKQTSKLLLLFIIFILAVVISTSGVVIGADEVQTGNTTNDSFNKSKKILERVIYKEPEHRIDIYCGCQYDEKKVVDFNSCGYKPERDNQRARRIEWEHVVPAEAFGQSFREWREGHPDCVDSKGRSFKGRKCVEKVNLEFRKMQSDMYNLYPAVGEINGLRSNYSMAMIPGNQYRFGECRTKIEDRKIEPRPEVRGRSPERISIWTVLIQGTESSLTRMRNFFRHGTRLIQWTNGNASVPVG